MSENKVSKKQNVELPQGGKLPKRDQKKYESRVAKKVVTRIETCKVTERTEIIKVFDNLTNELLNEKVKKQYTGLSKKTIMKMLRKKLIRRDMSNGEITIFKFVNHV